MSISNREKQLAKIALKYDLVTKDELDEMGFTHREIEEIENDRYLEILCLNVDYDTYTKTLATVSRTLGAGWDRKYDYKLTHSRGKYELCMMLTREEYERLKKEYEKGEKYGI